MNAKVSPTPQAIRILRLPEVCQVTGLKRAMIYRLQASNTFPQSVKITDHAVGWIDAEVQAWVEQRAAARTGDARGANTVAAHEKCSASSASVRPCISAITSRNSESTAATAMVRARSSSSR